MKPYYPAYLDLTKKSCVVIGGGNVANRKINSLIKTKADITVISPFGTRRISKSKINNMEKNGLSKRRHSRFFSYNNCYQ